MLTAFEEMLAVTMAVVQRCYAAICCCWRACSDTLLDLLVQGVPSQVAVVLFELQPSSSVFAVLHKVMLGSSSASVPLIRVGTHNTYLLCGISAGGGTLCSSLCALKGDDTADALLLCHSHGLLRSAEHAGLLRERAGEAGPQETAGEVHCALLPTEAL